MKDRLPEPIPVQWAFHHGSDEPNLLRQRPVDGMDCSAVQGDESAKRPVYHFVYHGERDFRLGSVSTLFDQKENSLI